MAPADDPEASIDVDLGSMSSEGLVDLIQKLEGSRHSSLQKRARKELVDRLKKEGFTVQRLAVLMTRNVYGMTKKRAIAKEWADSLGVTPNEFMKFIGK